MSPLPHPSPVLPPSRKPEALLLLACLALLALAVFAPSLAQPARYHQFADQRNCFDIPHAMNVLSNLPFAVFGMLGLLRLNEANFSSNNFAQRPMAMLFFIGLLITTLGSGVYHWQPTDASLALDRSGMVFAFAGLLGLAVAGRISARAGLWLVLAVLVLGPLSVWVWTATGNVLPWAVLQFGGLVLIFVMAWLKPLPQAWPVRWGAVVLIYAAAKWLELCDDLVYQFTGQLVSGHSLKHAVAALTAWPVICGIMALRQNSAGLEMSPTAMTPLNAHQHLGETN
jgi:hypothetical protein